MSEDHPTPPRRVTVRDIAREAGVSAASVSHAFRGDHNVSRETRERILEAADRLGYRPHPMVSALMSEIRRKRSVEGETVLAMVDFFTGSARLRKTSRAQIYEGALAQASKLGFRLDLFEPFEEGWSIDRLTTVLQSRGIYGIIVPPMPMQPDLPVDFPWEAFSVVTVGFVCQSHAFHCVLPDHLGGMEMVLNHLTERGCQRIGLYISADHDRRVRHAWSSLWLRHNVMEAHAPKSLGYFYAGAPDHAHFNDWVSQKKPDAMITDFGLAHTLLQSDARLSHIACATLIGAGGDCAGINQNYAGEGAAAVELMSSQLYRNERGIPSLRMLIHVVPTWVEQAETI